MTEHETSPAWVGYKNGEIVEVYPSYEYANAALKVRRVDAIAPLKQGKEK